MTCEEFSNEFDILLNSSFTTNDFGEQSNKVDIQLDEYEKSVFLTQAQEQLVINLYNGRNVEGLSFESAEESRRYLKELTERKTFSAIKTESVAYKNCYQISEDSVESFLSTFQVVDEPFFYDLFPDGTARFTGDYVPPYSRLIFPETIVNNGVEYRVKEIRWSIDNDTSIEYIIFSNGIEKLSCEFALCAIKAIFISNTVSIIDEEMFYDSHGHPKIYCEPTSKPNGWFYDSVDFKWCGNETEVFWGKSIIDFCEENIVKTDSINECLFITKETSILKDNNLPQWSNVVNNDKYLNVEVIPITQDEYHRFKRNPYKTFNEFRVLRIEDNNKLQLFSKYNIDTYSVDYIRKPKPIIVSDLGDDITIDGLTFTNRYNETPDMWYTRLNTSSASELNPILHRTILLEAVKLAKMIKLNQVRNEMLGNMPGQLVHPPMQQVNPRPN